MPDDVLFTFDVQYTLADVQEAHELAAAQVVRPEAKQVSMLRTIAGLWLPVVVGAGLLFAIAMLVRTGSNLEWQYALDSVIGYYGAWISIVLLLTFLVLPKRTPARIWVTAAICAAPMLALNYVQRMLPELDASPRTAIAFSRYAYANRLHMVYQSGPWLLLLLFFAFSSAKAKHSKLAKSLWSNNPHLQAPRTIELNSAGVIVREPLRYQSYAWAAVRGCVQSDNLVVLKTSSSAGVTIPKRFIGPKEACDRLMTAANQLLQRTQAFPVVSAASVEPAATT